MELELEEAPTSDLHNMEDWNADVTSSSQVTTGTQRTCELRNSALFLLKAREIHKVSQLALNDMTNEIAALNLAELEILKTKVCTRLRAAGV